MMKLLNDRIAVRRLDGPEKEGLIIIPECAKKAPIMCEVVDAGPGHRYSSGVHRASPVADGDKVLVSEWHGFQHTVEGQDLVIVREADIYAILDGNETVTV